MFSAYNFSYLSVSLLQFSTVKITEFFDLVKPKLKVINVLFVRRRRARKLLTLFLKSAPYIRKD